MKDITEQTLLLMPQSQISFGFGEEMTAASAATGISQYWANASIKSPLRWAGGKYYARKLILAQLPPAALVGTYIEPFCGGGSIFFAKPKAVTATVLADADPLLTNCLQQIRDNVEALIALLTDNIQISKAAQHFYKNLYLPTSDLERAFRYFYLNRVSYGGIMTRSHCYFGYDPDFSMPPSQWPGLLRRASAKLQGVSLVCQDFEETIEAAPDGACLFIDPPYWFAGSSRLYVHSFRLSDHLRLTQSLKAHAHRLSFLLTYDDVPEVRELYKWATSITHNSWRYNLNRTDYQVIGGQEQDDNIANQADSSLVLTGKRAMGKELFISNYQQLARYAYHFNKTSSTTTVLLTDPTNKHVQLEIFPTLALQTKKVG